MILTPLNRWISGKIGNENKPLTRKKIEAYQLKKLQEIIRWARTNSSFYKNKLSGLTKNDVTRLEHMIRLPFTTEEDIRQNPLQFLCISQSNVERVVTINTSGTTGPPKRIYFTEKDQRSTIDFFFHGMSTFTRPGESILILFPGENPGSVGDLLVKALKRLGATGIVNGPVQDIFQVLDIITQLRIDTLVGIPIQVLSLARNSISTIALKNVLLSGDYVSKAISNILSETWKCEVYTHYGMTEMGFGGGVECKAHYGYHMREADLFFEIINPETGKLVEDGEMGEIVFTTLTRLGMPLIRYRTGDLGRFIPKPCPCGTMLKTMARVKGGIKGLIELRTGQLLTMADLDEALFPIKDVLDFNATLTSEQDMDCLLIELNFLENHCYDMLFKVNSALENIPLLKSAKKKGKLKISTACRLDFHHKLESAEKRTINDLR